MQNTNTYSIVLRDDEANILIAEISTFWDQDRLYKEIEKLKEEFFSDNYDWDPDFYNELSNRTWLTIYHADVLDI
jgi:hypothetical protein